MRTEMTRVAFSLLLKISVVVAAVAGVDGLALRGRFDLSWHQNSRVDQAALAASVSVTKGAFAVTEVDAEELEFCCGLCSLYHLGC